MDRSLWFHLSLRIAAGARKCSRSLRTWKGMLFGLTGVFCFAPILLMAFMPSRFIESMYTAVNQHGPIALLCTCVLNVVLSTGERAVYYTRAEIAFFFTGPFPPRQVLLYKLIGGLGGAVFTALVFSIGSPWFGAAFLGIYLALAMTYLFTMAVSLIAGTVGALAFNRARKLVLAGAAAVFVIALVNVGRDLFHLPPMEVLGRMEQSPAVQLAATPFVPAVRTYTAMRTWPDLVQWSAAGFAVDAALLGLVIALSGGYYEASMAASARRYERLRSGRPGGLFTRTEKFRFSLPMPPRLGGAGPVAWRQVTAATRSFTRALAVSAFFVLPVVATVIFLAPLLEYPMFLGIAIGVPIGLALLAPSVIGFDFRPDLERIDVLKTLPIAPSGVIVGQLITPVLVLTVAEWVALGSILLAVRLDATLIITLFSLSVPVNILLLEVENLFFLWFPVPLMPTNAVDFQTVGRLLILLIIKVCCVGFAVAIAMACGYAAYYIFRESWPASIATAGLVTLGIDLGLVPLLVQAFNHFNVASERPE